MHLNHGDTQKIHNVPHPVVELRDNEDNVVTEFVQREDPLTGSEFLLSLDGAKTFKSPTSKSYPLPDSVERVMDAFVMDPEFPLLSKEEKTRRVEKVLMATVAHLRRSSN